jgi:hypothetical protein
MASNPLHAGAPLDDPRGWFVPIHSSGGAMDEDVGFGQHIDMPTSIATIIKDYSSGKIIQELLQNCDDGMQSVSMYMC